MVSRDDKLLVLWPEYFDSSLSRAEGRRVARKYSVATPRLEDIAKAARSIGLRPTIEEDRAYPGKWWKKSGRVLVPMKFKKQKVLIKIGARLKKNKK